MRFSKAVLLGVLVVGVWAPGALGQTDDLIGEPVGDPVGDQAGTLRLGLSNGLELVVVSTSQYPQSDVQVWLIVRAGSMYEQDDQRGSALVLERAIREGTRGFTGEQISAMLERADENQVRRPEGSFVGFDHSGFMGQVHKDDPGAMEELLGFYREVLDHDLLVLDDRRIEEVISGLIDEGEEIKEEGSADRRARRRWLPELMRGSLFGDRLPKPTGEQLRTLSPERVRAFGRKLYHPGQAMVVVVGDVDPRSVEALVAKAMGSIKNGERSVMIDGRIKQSLSMRAVFDRDPGFEKNQGAMIWLSDRDAGSVDAWTVRAGRYSTIDVRKTVINRAAGEVVRYRLERQGAQVLGDDAQISADQIDLFGQVDILQIGVESSDGRWEDSIGFLVRQCDRLSRDGASSDELARARRSLLARWHRDADDWVGRSNSERMGLVHWLITTGRPMIDMVGWDAMATGMMDSISDEEIGSAMTKMMDTSKASYIALSKEELGGQDSSLVLGSVLGVVKRAMGEPMDAIDPRWMELLGGSLIDDRAGDEHREGKIEEIFEHVESGVLGGKLGNSVMLWSRAIGDQVSAGVSIRATIWGSVLDDGSLSDDEISAAMIAWDSAATESRSSLAIKAYIEEHSLRVWGRTGDGYVRLSVDSDAGSIDQAMELVFALLDQPMIEGGAFDRWLVEQGSAQSDPIEEGIDGLYVDKRRGGTAGLTLDRAQRVLTQIVRNGRIDIAIVGAIDPERVIEDGGELFGSLVDRSVQIDNEPGAKPGGGGLGDGLGGERVIRIVVENEKEHGLAMSYVGGDDLDLQSVRAMILSAMVLNDRLKDIASKGGFDGVAGFTGSVRSNVWTSDAIEGRKFVMTRVWCARSGMERAWGIVDETIEGMVRDGIGADELRRAQERIDDSIGRYFDTPGYWSARLSMLGYNGRRVEDLWGIREGYSGIGAGFASRVFGELVAGNERFRIEIVGAAGE